MKQPVSMKASEITHSFRDKLQTSKQYYEQEFPWLVFEEEMLMSVTKIHYYDGDS